MTEEQRQEAAAEAIKKRLGGKGAGNSRGAATRGAVQEAADRKNKNKRKGSPQHIGR